MIDFIVRTLSPDLLDQTVRQLPGCEAWVVDGSFDGDVCTLRVAVGAGFLRFALAQQGYGELVREEPVEA